MDNNNRITLSDTRAVLSQVIDRARELGQRGVVAFDLDSTVFDNRPRQVRIFREYGAARGLPALLSCRTEHFTSWDLRQALLRCGLDAKTIEETYPDFKTFWRQRFFTSEYCLEDVLIPGAGEFVAEVAGSGARICYVTGRHQGMRDGTLKSFSRWGLPRPAESKRVSLVMKPSLEESDDGFKRQAHRQLGKLGDLAAVFDNEPTHANDYRRAFPQALVVHVATDNSGRDVKLLEGIVSIPSFEFAN